jgi:hypothetical protein
MDKRACKCRYHRRLGRDWKPSARQSSRSRFYWRRVQRRATQNIATGGAGRETKPPETGGNDGYEHRETHNV